MTKRKPSPRYWTRDQIILLKELYPFYDLEIIRKKIGRDADVGAIRAKLKELGLHKKKLTKKQLIKLHYQKREGYLKQFPTIALKQSNPSLKEALVGHYFKEVIGGKKKDWYINVSRNKIIEDGFEYIVVTLFDNDIEKMWREILEEKVYVKALLEIPSTAYGRNTFKILRDMKLPNELMSEFRKTYFDLRIAKDITKLLKEKSISEITNKELVENGMRYACDAKDRFEIYNIYEIRSIYYNRKIVKSKKWSEENKKRVISEVVRKEDYCNAFEAAQHFTYHILKKYNLNTLKEEGLLNLLKLHYGDKVKPWMLKNKGSYNEFGTIQNPNVESIKEILEFRANMLNKEVKELRGFDFRADDFGYYKFLEIYKDNFHELLNIYYNKKLESWEWGVKTYWDDQKLTKAVLQILKKYRIKDTDIAKKLSTYHFKCNGLSGLLSFKGKIFDIVSVSHKKHKFKKEDFRYCNEDAVLGRAFEVLCEKLFREELNKKFKYNKNHECGRPDFQNLSLKGISNQTSIVDCKLRVNTYYNSKTSKYLKHTNDLIIIYLGEKLLKKGIVEKDIVDTDGVKFVHISKILRSMPNTKQKSYINDFNEIMMEGIPESLSSHTMINPLKVCKLLDDGDCTLDKKLNIRGIVISLGLCSKHYSRFNLGYIDKNGNKLKKITRRSEIEITEEQIKYLIDNQATEFKDIAQFLFGSSEKTFIEKVRWERSKLGLKRSKKDINVLKKKRREEKFLSYKDAQKYFRDNNIDIKSVDDWRHYSRNRNRGRFKSSPQRPTNIPSNLAKIYKGKGWKGTAYFFGYNKKSIKE